MGNRFRLIQFGNLNADMVMFASLKESPANLQMILEAEWKSQKSNVLHHDLFKKLPTIIEKAGSPKLKI